MAPHVSREHGGRSSSSRCCCCCCFWPFVVVVVWVLGLLLWMLFEPFFALLSLLWKTKNQERDNRKMEEKERILNGEED